MQEIIIEDKTKPAEKPKRSYTRKAVVSNKKVSPPALIEDKAKTGIMALPEADQRRHAEMDYIIGIIDTLVLKHASKHGLPAQQVKDDLLVRIIRGVYA